MLTKLELLELSDTAKRILKENSIRNRLFYVAHVYHRKPIKQIAEQSHFTVEDIERRIRFIQQQIENALEKEKLR